jgi:hypothetical protein
MGQSAKPKTSHHFSILYRYFEDLRLALEFAAAKSVTAVVIRSANDGGDPDWEPSNTPCLTVDLDIVSGFDRAVSATENRIFDTVIFSSDPERDLQFVQMTPGEVRFSQEIMWRRLGSKGRIVGYPLPPKPELTSSDNVLSPEEFDIRFKALLKDDA